MRLGISTGIQTSLGVGISPTGSVTVAQQMTTTSGGIVWDEIWPGVKESVGTNAHTMTEQTGASENNATTGLVSGNNISEVAFNIPDASATAAYDCTDNTIGDPGSSTLYLMVVKLENTNPGATLTHFGKRRKSGDFGGIEVTTATSGQPTARIDVGAGAGVTAACTTDHYDGNWHVIAVLVDQNAGNISIASETDSQVDTAFSTSLETNTEVLTLGEHRLDSAQGEYALFAIATGAQVEGVNIKTLCDNFATQMIV